MVEGDGGAEADGDKEDGDDGGGEDGVQGDVVDDLAWESVLVVDLRGKYRDGLHFDLGVCDSAHIDLSIVTRRID